jgi:hypothetical protein
MTAHAYTECLERSYKVNWKIKDVLGELDFDLDRRWLPVQLSGAYGIFCLDPDEKRKLTHVELGGYAHLFGFVEAFIAPEMSALALDAGAAHPEAFEALTQFASEEVKHMHLFREVRRRVDARLGFPLGLLEGAQEVAQAVLRRHRAAVLLLTAAIEWLTQAHFLNAMKHSDGLDPLTKEIFRAHWLEEAQHAQLDRLETLRVFKDMDGAERDLAIEDLIWLLAALDGLLQRQAEHDLHNLERYLGRSFQPADREEIHRSVLQAKRVCFIESGISHPQFQELFLTVTTPVQRERVLGALDLVAARPWG